MCVVRFSMRLARPRARGRQRLIVTPSSANASCTMSSSGERPWLASALATAERSTSSMSLATARFEYSSSARASSTFLPRMCASTSRAFCGDERTQRACARTRPVLS